MRLNSKLIGVVIPIISDIYQNDSIRGGIPHTDEIFLIKLLVLQQRHNLSDYNLRKNPMIHLFQHFLGYPPSIQNRSTIWKYLKRLRMNKKEDTICNELQRQLNMMGF